MSNAITLTIPQARLTMERLAPEFAKVLPNGVTADRFRRVCLTALQQNQKLLECSPDSLWGACMKAAQDGLLPDGREGAIVPRWNSRKRDLEAHWMPMVFGLIAKAKRKGSVANLSAQVVYEGERFRVLLGDDERIEHVRDVSLVHPGKEVAVYAIATMKDGSKEREVMSWEQVQQVADVSQKDKDGNLGAVWRVWGDEMARKSCIRRLSKRLPSLDDGDDELRQAVERVDDLYDFGKPAVAAPAQVQSVTHEQVVPVQVEAAEPEPAHAAPPARQEMNAALHGDEIPDFDAPPPPPPKPKRTLGTYLDEKLAACNTADELADLVGADEVIRANMGKPSVKERVAAKFAEFDEGAAHEPVSDEVPF